MDYGVKLTFVQFLEIMPHIFSLFSKFLQHYDRSSSIYSVIAGSRNVFKTNKKRREERTVQ
jgi:hypothetical protein